MNTNYERLKLYVTSRAQNTIWANELGSCTDIDEFIKYIKIHFISFCKERFITEWVINEFEDIFNEYHIFCNKNTTQGYLLVTKGQYVAKHNTVMVIALNRAKVDICNKVICFAFDNTCIIAHHETLTYASDNANILSLDSATVKCSDKTFIYSCGFSNVFAKDKSTIEATEYSTLTIQNDVKLKAYGGVLVRSFGVRKENIHLFDLAVVIDYNTKIIRTYDKEVDL